MTQIYELIDQENDYKRIIFLNEIEEVFVLSQGNGVMFESTFGTSPMEIDELLSYFQGHIEEKRLSVLSQELNYLATNKIWEDEEKFKSIISYSFSNISLVPIH